MQNIRLPSSGLLWRRALAVVAAYLLVLQAALAGGAMQRMEAPAGFATEIICLNGDAGAPSGDHEQHKTFDCCGLGCLVGAQSLGAPVSPALALAYPAERALRANPARAGPKLKVAGSYGPGLRGPPAAA